ncbi:hypothetical protein GOP47_0030029 [Adiantum capillus-veneris]|nr:hypothetical protein GOP47_0030029 [Adiantum capillus-veneris]
MSWEDESIGPDVAAAGRLVTETISRDLASPDLYEVLDAARYTSNPYSSPPKDWPSLVDVASNRELPPVLIERYNAAGGQGTALCGIFPSIRRAWATVDNSLFLWRFDKWDGLCPEYSGEEQALCAVGLAKARSGIFVEAIQHLLILATPVEIVLLGVCCSANGDSSDPFAELSMQLLHEYTIPSDGVTMTSIQTTDQGRIFLAGRDGHIYELLYSSGASWKSRCRKVCLTSGLGSLLSRWVLPNSFTFGTVDPVVEMVVDNERNILYTRTHESKIQVFDLGKNGEGSLKKVAEERNIGDQRDGRFGTGRTSGRRSSSRVHKSPIVSISTLSSAESKSLHLVAVTSDGRRMYLSTSSSVGSRGLSGSTSSSSRPSTLKLVMSRPAPSVGTGGVISFSSLALGGRPQPESLVLKVESAYYSSGFLSLSDASPATMSRLLLVTKDLTTPSGSFSVSSASTVGSYRALRETVSVLGVDGRTLAIADSLPPPEYMTIAESAVWDVGDNMEEELTRAKRLWVRGELALQHAVPRRRSIIFTNVGLMEVVFNRPVDLLQKILENKMSHSLLEDFFQRYGAGEAAAMCLLLAARLTPMEGRIVPSAVVERAAEAFEDSRLVGVPQLQGSGPSTSPIASPAMGFNMGQVVQEATPVYSGAHEGLCLCTARLLWPIWELPVMVLKGESTFEDKDGGIVVCRLLTETMQALEEKLRGLEQFLRSRRNERRGLYGRIFGLGDLPSFYGNGNLSSIPKNLFDAPQGINTQSLTNKRQRIPYSSTELSVMEVRGLELIRRLLRRSGEALLLLQMLCQHHVARLAQIFDSNLRRKLVHLTFHQLVCSEDGEQIATRLIAALMEYYMGLNGQGSVDDISMKLREGCPSFYQETDYTFYQAVECLKKAREDTDPEQRERLAREALALLGKVPESADLLSVCQRFEEIRFYEAVVELPLRKAKALDPNDDAMNDHIDENRREVALLARQQCYEIIGNALRHLKEEGAQTGFRSGFGTLQKAVLDKAVREKYIRQIVQLSVRWPDRPFHEFLYQTMIDIGLENELLELAGPDLVPFLQNAGSRQTIKTGPAARKHAMPSIPSSLNQSKQPVTEEEAKYLELLARYYVHHRQHVVASHVLLRLAERRQVDGGGMLSLEQRFQYLSSAVLQAKNATLGSPSTNLGDGGLLELLEGKLAVLRFQIKIKEELELLITRSEDALGPTSGDTSMMDPFPGKRLLSEEATLHAAKEKLEDLGRDMKSISQLYNDYAVPFEMWEVCLDILHFSNYARNSENNVMKDTWARLIDQAILAGGVAEACTVLRRVGPRFFPGDGGSLPLDTICLHLEKVAQDRVASGKEAVGDEDIPRALIIACKDAAELVQRVYDRLLATAVAVPSPLLRLRMLRSVLTVMREWNSSIFGNTVGTTALSLKGGLSFGQLTSMSQGVKEKIATAANRYMTEVRRLSLPPIMVEPVYQGFRELEEVVMGPPSF